MAELNGKSQNLIFQDRSDILLEMRLGGVAKQGYTMLYRKSQVILCWIDERRTKWSIENA